MIVSPTKDRQPPIVPGEYGRFYTYVGSSATSNIRRGPRRIRMRPLKRALNPLSVLSGL